MLHEARRDVADKAYENFEFIMPPVEASGWEVRGDWWRRTVYFDVGMEHTVSGEFMISFKPGTAEIELLNRHPVES